jgi:hypothetical protein
MKYSIFTLSSLFWFVLIAVLVFGCKKQNQPEQTSQSVTIEQNRESTEQAASAESDSVAKQNLRILYVSHPGSDRAKDFEGFLSKHFIIVKMGDLKAFRESDSENFDVTILDYDGDGFKAPRPQISPNFSRPVVTVGVMGGLLCNNLSLKTGYL